jgi:tetratricopeptide (TPR) repeat protein
MRAHCLLAVLILGVPGIVSARSLEDAEKYLKRRDYPGAIQSYEETLKENPRDTLALKGLAMVYTKKRDWDKAGETWKKLLDVIPDEIEANSYRWYALLEEAGEDSALLKGRRELVEEEALRFLERSANRENAYSIAYDGLRIAEADSARIKKLEASIIDSFPRSLKAYEIAGEKFYDGLYPIWNDDTLKIRFLERYLVEYPIDDWSFTAYQYILSSLKRLKDVKGIREYGRKMLAEHSLDPFAHDYLARILLDVEIDTVWALELAEKAVRLEPEFEKPTHKPEEQWELEKEPLAAAARREAATALMTLGRLDEAEKWAREAMEAYKPSLNNFATRASLYYTLGRILELKGKKEEALEAYVDALVEGDMTNTWSGKADSSLEVLHKEIFGAGESILECGRRVKGYTGITFTDVTEEMGLEGRRESRVAWADFNNDGYDDLILSGRRLLANSRGDTFLDVTASSGIEAGASSGAVCADFDNDGNIDFYSISGGKEKNRDRLWKGNGDGTFVSAVRAEETVSDTLTTEGAGWGDFDSDGLVDLYCANYEVWQKASGLHDFLYRNNGDGTFSDVTEKAGIEPPFDEDRAGRGVNWGDYDSDGDLDVYVSNYRLQENFLYRNNGDGTFTNVAAELGVAGDEADGWWGHTIGSEWGDYDSDGDLDLVTANLAHPRYIEFSNKTMLYENTGPPEWLFVDRRERAGIKYDETHSDPSWGDIDSDGDLDLFITSIYEGRRSFLYENVGGGRFVEITWLAGVRAFNGWGCAFSDFDNDGDLDLFVASGSGCHLYRNDGNKNRWLEVKVVGGEKSNRAGIGTRVMVRQGKRVQIREVQGGKGTTSQHSLVQFFGLGEGSRPVDVYVRFPSGNTVERKGVSANQRILIKEE